MNTPSHPQSAPHAHAEVFSKRVVARLNDGTQHLPYDITERLRASREQALGQRKRVVARRHAVPAHIVNGRDTATLSGWEPKGWWSALVSALPLTALVFGLIAIHLAQDENAVNDVIEVDAALLTDDLPPAAYADPGFVQFLKAAARPH